MGESDVGSKKFLRNNGVDGFKNLRRSQRLSNQQKVVNEHEGLYQRMKAMEERVAMEDK